MIPLQFPKPGFRIKKEGETNYIFDPIRKTWVVLTEEEWVRQNFINYLVTSLHYPSSVIAVEKEIRLHDLKKRFDILVYNKNHSPAMLVECKAPFIHLDEEVLHQALRYNISVPVQYIVITNGNHTMGWRKDSEGMAELEVLPLWESFS